MTTQIIFKVDQKLKDKAMAKAKNDGIAFSTILKLATQAFVNGDLSLGLIGNERFNVKTAKTIKQTLKDIEKNTHLSPSFSSAKSAMKFLES